MLAAIVIAGAGCLITPKNYEVDNIRPTSPFHKYVEHFKPYDQSTENEISNLVLKELPLGSSLSAIQDFISRHFTVTKGRKRPATNDIEAPVKNQPYIYVRVWSWGQTFAGSWHLDFIFILDDSDRLKDVRSSCDGSWV